jgi:flagellar assembly protein FliH
VDEAGADRAIGDSAAPLGDGAGADSDSDSTREQVVSEPAAPDPAALLEQIEAERVQVLEQAYDEGYRAGEEAGRSDGQRAYDDQVNRLRAVGTEMSAAFDRHIEEAEDLLVEIAFESVCKILGRALRDRDGVSAIVQEVMHQAREREQLIVRLAPPDYALLTGRPAPLEEPRRSEEPVSEFAAWNAQMMPDPRVALGGCLIESPGGTLDGRLETQLQRLREVLVAARASKANEGT